MRRLIQMATAASFAMAVACAVPPAGKVPQLKTITLTRNCGGSHTIIPASAGVDSFVSCWYSEQLRAMKEPRLMDAPVAEGDTVLRFMELPSFTHATAVRLERRAGATTMVTTVLDGGGGYAPGKILERRTGVFPNTAWAAIQSVIELSRMAEQPVRREHPWISLDGTEWIVEVKTASRYQLIVREAPDGDVAQVAQLIMRLTDMPPAGVVRGHISDAETGLPLRNLRVMWHRLSDSRQTDSAGDFLYEGRPLGKGEIWAECARENGAIGAYLPVFPVTIARGETTSVHIRAPAHICDTPAFSSRAMVISGFVRGDSAEFFVPDPDSSGSPIIYGGNPRYRHATVRFATDSLRNSIVSWPPSTRVRADFLGTDLCYHVTFHGTLTGPGSYGSYGSASYELVVDAVLAVRPIKRGECRLR